MKIVEQLTHSYKTQNEDIWGCTHDLAWVIDGATPLSGANYSGWHNDAVWYVHFLDSYFRRTPHREAEGPNEYLAQAVAAAQSSYHSFAPPSLGPDDEPSAAIALVMRKTNRLLCYTLGDCAVWGIGGEESFGISDKSVAHYDDIAVRHLHQLQVDQGLSFVEAREATQALLQKHRRLKNMPNGYKILSLDPDVFDSTAGVWQLWPHSTGELLLCSDGYSRLYELYQVGPLPSAWLRTHDTNLGQHLETIRQIEQNDTQCLRYPRTSVHDDVTAIRISF